MVLIQRLNDPKYIYENITNSIRMQEGGRKGTAGKTKQGRTQAGRKKVQSRTGHRRAGHMRKGQEDR
jgi:hypothetical protein